MRFERQNEILKLISENSIETQEEILEKLSEKGFNTTQATISRDIKELKLIKVQDESGRYKYHNGIKSSSYMSTILMDVLKNVTVSFESVDNMVVIKTISGGAGSAAEAIDNISINDIVGTIAGDNTIFVLLRSKESALNMIRELDKIIR